MLRANRSTSNAKVKKILGWKPIANNEEAIVATIKSMIKFGNLKIQS
jgi:nucleoside-diphosphate-sugar epimerase